MRLQLRALIRGGASAAGAALIASCTSALFGIANIPARFGDYERHAEIPYAPGLRHSLDVYAPKNVRGAPVIMFWYGGSWTDGSKELYRFVGAALANAGYLAVLPDYGVYPSVKFPTFMEDGARAVAWTVQHARDYGGDPTQIFLMGHSAGAHIAALLALDYRYLRGANVDMKRIRGLIGLSGPYALRPTDAPLNVIFAAPYTPADWQPVRYVSAQSPPALLFHGVDDSVVRASHTQALDAAYVKAGVPAEVHLYPQRKHADTVAALSIPARNRLPVLEQVVSFVQSISRQ